ncbi:MAG: DUF4019 domain-containing protein [Candidatus Omnitrophica bacterium]|nr:DUF4019 domain-containing protein [Candidatus Omnitrophota bacterium]
MRKIGVAALTIMMSMLGAAVQAKAQAVPGKVGESASAAATEFAAKKARGQQVAAVWLALIDDGKYVDSWKQSAGFFRNAVPQEQWEQMMRGYRQPLGKNVSREIAAVQYVTTMPAAPDGEYVLVDYTSAFERKKHATESVTVMKDTDNIWRVSGYFIQ